MIIADESILLCIVYLHREFRLVRWARGLSSLLRLVDPILIKDVNSPMRGKVESFVSLQLVKSFHRSVWQQLVLEVSDDPLLGDTLGQNHLSPLYAPAHQHLAGIHAQFLSNKVYFGVVDGLWFAGLVVSQRTVGLHHHAFVLTELEELPLLQVGMCFDLVDGWRDRGDSQ